MSDPLETTYPTVEIESPHMDNEDVFYIRVRISRTQTRALLIDRDNARKLVNVLGRWLDQKDGEE